MSLRLIKTDLQLDGLLRNLQMLFDFFSVRSLLFSLVASSCSVLLGGELRNMGYFQRLVKPCS